MGSMRFFLILALLIPLGVSGHTVSWSSDTEVSESNTTIIYMHDDGFEPENITVEHGTAVTFKNVSETKSFWPASNVHPTHAGYPGSGIEKCESDARALIFDACGAVLPGESYTFQFDEPGEWRYHDHIDDTISGTITVEGYDADSFRERLRNWFTARAEDIGLFFDRFILIVCPQCEQRMLDAITTEGIRFDEAKARRLVALFGADKVMAALVDASPHVSFESGTREQCHAAAHIVGRAAYQVYGGDVFGRAIDARCQYGFLHGSIESMLAHYNGDTLVPSFNARCLEQVDLNARAQCQHALGHGLMVYYNYNLPEALDACEALSGGALLRCYEGAYMENAFTSYESAISARVHTSAWIDPTRPDFPCDASIIQESGGIRTAMCYYVQPLVWIQPREGVTDDVSAGMEGCARAPDAVKDICYQGVGIVLGGVVSGNETLARMCREAPSEYVYSCVAGIATVLRAHWKLDYEQEKNLLCFFLDTNTQDACRAAIDERSQWTFEI